MNKSKPASNLNESIPYFDLSAFSLASKNKDLVLRLE
jgi:hypothetical protein